MFTKQASSTLWISSEEHPSPCLSPCVVLSASLAQWQCCLSLHSCPTVEASSIMLMVPPGFNCTDPHIYTFEHIHAQDTFVLQIDTSHKNAAKKHMDTSLNCVHFFTYPNSVCRSAVYISTLHCTYATHTQTGSRRALLWLHTVSRQRQQLDVEWFTFTKCVYQSNKNLNKGSTGCVSVESFKCKSEI